MMTVHKYPLADLCSSYQVSMPEGAELLAFQLQFEQPTVWAKVDLRARLVDRLLVLVGTGHELPQVAGVVPAYVGTLQQAGGRLVWHLFDYGEVTL
jgi:hypothetical protein